MGRVCDYCAGRFRRRIEGRIERRVTNRPGCPPAGPPLSGARAALSKDCRDGDAGTELRPAPASATAAELAEATELRVTFGHVLDNLPPTCSLKTKTERLRAWLAERSIDYCERN